MTATTATTATITAADVLDEVTGVEAGGHAMEIACPCGRSFIAKTEARVGVTRSNAKRHAAKCADAQAAALHQQYVADNLDQDDMAGAEIDAAIFDKAQAQEGSELLLSPSGKTAKMVTVSNVAYVTTDGRFATVKDGAEKATAWSLYRLANVDTVDRSAVRVGQFRTCNEAFAPENVSA